MTAPVRNPTLDDAMSEFQAMLREALGDSLSDAATRPMTPEEQEEARYRFAEAVLNLACPDPKACSHRHCRRKARCRHLARVAAKRASGKVSHPRRTPGAEAARYAVRVLMSSGGEGTALPDSDVPERVGACLTRSRTPDQVHAGAARPRRASLRSG